MKLELMFLKKKIMTKDIIFPKGSVPAFYNLISEKTLAKLSPLVNVKKKKKPSHCNFFLKKKKFGISGRWGEGGGEGGGAEGESFHFL